MKHTFLDDNAIDRATEVLNRALKKDPEAIVNLINYRFECNYELAEDPTIQVLNNDGNYKVGLLGIINGILGVDEDGYGPISLILNNNNELIGFERYVK